MQNGRMHWSFTVQSESMLLFMYMLTFCTKNAVLLHYLNNENSSPVLEKKLVFHMDFHWLGKAEWQNHITESEIVFGRDIRGAHCPVFPSKRYYPWCWVMPAMGLSIQVLKTSKCVQLIHGQPVPVLHHVPGDVSFDVQPEPPNLQFVSITFCCAICHS